jgi:hypothetical protein
MANRKKAGGKKAATKKAGSKVTTKKASQKKSTGGSKKAGPKTGKPRAVKKKKDKKIVPNGAPITIGGGSGIIVGEKDRGKARPAAGVLIKLTGNWQHPSGNKFVNPDYTLSILWLLVGDAVNWKRYDLTSEDEIVISLAHVDHAADPTPINIVGGQLQIKFSTAEIPFNGRKGGHYVAYRVIDTIDVSGDNVFSNDGNFTIPCQVKVE